MEILRRKKPDQQVTPRQSRSAIKLNRLIQNSLTDPSKFSTTWNATLETDVDTALFKSKKKGKKSKIVFRLKDSSKNPEGFATRIQDINPNVESEIIQIGTDGRITSETVIRAGTRFEDSLQPRELTPKEIRDLYKQLKRSNTNKLYKD